MSLTSSPSMLPRGRRKGEATFLLVLSGVVLYLVVIPGDNLQINLRCRPRGLVASLRATLQGQRFWSSQLVQLDREVASISTLPERMAAAEAQVRASPAWEKVEQSKARIDWFLDSVYAMNPQLADPRIKSPAKLLRAAADSAERAEFSAQTDGARHTIVASLLACRPDIAARAATPP